MQSFSYARAANVEQIIDEIGTDTMVIAGGTELLNWQRLGIAAPPRVLDIGRVASLRGVRIEDHHLVIGALVTLAELGEHELAIEHAGALAEACVKAASPQLRNRATLGGNVLQKTRCAYFRSESPLPWGCNKRIPGSGCAARHGVNERHALFGWTDACVATHPSDPAVAAVALDAEIELRGRSGTRRMALEDFFVTQEAAADAGCDAATTEHALRSDEIIVAFRVPVRPGRRSAYLKVRERESYEYALVSAAAAVTLDEGRIVTARVVLGSVAQRPWRLGRAEPLLVGLPIEREALMPVIVGALDDARPLERNRMKLRLAQNSAVRALLLAGSAT